MARVLIVDDEQSIRTLLSAVLKSHGHDIVAADDGETALALLGAESVDLVLTDVRMHKMNGIALLKELQTRYPLLPAIVVTAYASVQTAKEAMTLGAFDYCVKPFQVDKVLEVVEKGLAYGKRLLERETGEITHSPKYYFDGIIAESKSMRDVCDMIRKVALPDTPVMIHGEMGTGKTLVARSIHNCTHRKDKRFLSLNCATVPDPVLECQIFGEAQNRRGATSSIARGAFETAGGGTIVLDEIEFMPQHIQRRLADSLAAREVTRLGRAANIPITTRIIATSNASRETLLARQMILDDLYLRLSVFAIEIRPLRERREDIIPLACSMLAHAVPAGQAPPSFDRGIRAILESYPWPGNASEMANVLGQAVKAAKGGRITKDALPEHIARSMPAADGATSAADSIDADRGQMLKAFLSRKVGIKI